MTSLIQIVYQNLRTAYNHIVMCITFFCLWPFSHPSCGQLKLVNQKVQDQQQQQQLNGKINQVQTKTTKRKMIVKTKKGSHKSTHVQHQQNNQQENSEQNKKLKFIMAFNRDQQCLRRTHVMGPYEEDPNIYAGRDIKSTGTWLGVNIKTAIMVILTNYDLPAFRPGKSRGQLVKSFLQTSLIPEDKLEDSKFKNNRIEERLKAVLDQCKQKAYAAFNLLVYNIKGDNMYYICSEAGRSVPDQLETSKMYGLCNTDINTLWPKTKHGLALFQQCLSKHKNKSDDQILNSLINDVMKDKKAFSQNPNDESSIFLEPFYSTLQNAWRMTKSTFVVMIKELKEGKLELKMKQITHQSSDKFTKQCLEKQSNKGFFNDNDHQKQVVQNFQFTL